MEAALCGICSMAEIDCRLLVSTCVPDRLNTISAMTDDSGWAMMKMLFINVCPVAASKRITLAELVTNEKKPHSNSALQ